MIAFRTPGSEMEERMDCNYYHPRYVENSLKLGRHSCCVFASTYKTSDIGHTASVEPHYSNNEVGVPFVSGKTIKAFDLQTDGCERITHDSHNGPLSGCKLKPGYLLIIRKGSVGNACVVPQTSGELNCSSEVMFLEMKSLDDAYFFAAFFNSKHGRLAIERLQRGTIIFGVSLLDIPPLRVFWPDSGVRRYIGEKVRQAERLRKSARAIDDHFVNTIRHRCPEVFGTKKEFGRASRVSAASLRRDLNPGAFNPERLRIRAEIKKAGGRELIEVASIEASVTDSFGPEDDYIGLDSVSSTTSQLTPVKVAQAEVEGAARILREGPVISKLRPYLNKVSYIPAELARAVGSTELLCVKPKPGVSGWFIYGVLKLQCTVGQFQPLANGSTLPRIDASDVLDVMVPWHDDADLLGKELEQAQTMYFTAEKLTTAAKHLVEALIEGKVTATDIIEIQQELELGNNSSDRALLRRLTRQGLDVPDQPPLFPNLDALYALIAQTQEEPA